ncbi:YopT-type cysteine protease domain-containing protein [Rahnella rivi]|uniref:YopT-type cysteine protease domain-containing protein n=1 Tax=Rahnella rivi TaxID=2816249 RepID=UPI0039BE4C8C
MPADIDNLVTMLNGKRNKFLQDDYISGNQWDNINPMQRQGAWTNNNYDSQGNIQYHGLGAGVCLGLSSAYLISGTTWPDFMNYITSPLGKVQIRGVQNLLKELTLSRPKNLSTYKCQGNINSKEVMTTVLRNKGISYIKGGNMMTNKLLESIRTDILQNMSSQNGYIIIIGGQAGLHAFAIRAGVNVLKFFDPNHGEFIFPTMNGQGDLMALFLLTYIADRYPNFNKCDVSCFKLR